MRYPFLVSPNASNARQGIKTLYDQIESAVRAEFVRTPPMPDRALRLWDAAGLADPLIQHVRTPPMPDRALRRAAPLGRAGRPPWVRTPPMPDRALRHHGEVAVLSEEDLRPNASNARQGIKTQG